MKGSTLLGVILVGTAALFFGWSFSYGGMAGFVPLVLAFPTLVLAALCLAGERYPRIMSAFEVSLEDVLTSAAGAEDAAEAAAQQGPRAGEFALIVRMFVWFTVFGVLVFISGFYVSTFLFAAISPTTRAASAGPAPPSLPRWPWVSSTSSSRRRWPSTSSPA